MMLQSRGFKRVLLLHGETPTRFSNRTDRSVALLFGDAGSATALEMAESLGSQNGTSACTPTEVASTTLSLRAEDFGTDSRKTRASCSSG